MAGQLVSVIGRRQAVKYLSLGLLSMAVAACGGEKSGGGIKGAALTEFAAGQWVYSMGDQTGRLVIRKDSGWRLTDDAGWQAAGTWALKDGGITLQSEDFDGISTVEGVPGAVDDGYEGRQVWNFWDQQDKGGQFTTLSSYHAGVLFLELTNGSERLTIELRRVT